MSSDAWWLRGPEPATVATAADLPEVVDRPAPEPRPHREAPADPYQGVTLVLDRRPDPAPPDATTPGTAEPATPEPTGTEPSVPDLPVPEPDDTVTSPEATAGPALPNRRGRRAPAPRRRHRLVVAAVAAGTAVAAGSAALATVLARDGAGGGRRPPAAAVAVAVDPAAVTARATSTQDPQGGATYDAANTLDGDPATAWNSDGAPTGRGPGARPVSLTYRFTRPVELRTVVLRNGYQKLRRRAGKPPVDLYPANARVHRLRVVTDAGAWTWDLADVRAPQSFAGAAGRTASVRLEIVSVYPSTTYSDVALSEVGFTALPTTS